MNGKRRVITITALWAVTLALAGNWLLGSTQQTLSIAAGPRTGESFELISGISEVLEAELPGTRIDVFETQGSDENLRLLQAGQVDLATLPADVEVSDRIEAVATLFFDAYQLVATESSGVTHPSELVGKRIAVPPARSGQNRSFWFIMDHYRIAPDDLTALPMSDEAANFAMSHGQIDALFRIRVPGNHLLKDLVEENAGLRIVPIEQSAAMALARPTLSAGVVPMGAYRGHPPVPQRDLETAVQSRLLVANPALDEGTVLTITRSLFERRAEMVAITTLAGFIRPLADADMVSVPLHAGARRYYERDKPGFLEQNTRVLAALLYVIAIATSAGIALRARFKRAQRVRMSDYNAKLMGIAERATGATQSSDIAALKDELVDILKMVIADLEGDRVTQEEFDHFSFTWQAVDTLVRDRSPAAVT